MRRRARRRYHAGQLSAARRCCRHRQDLADLDGIGLRDAIEPEPPSAGHTIPRSQLGEGLAVRTLCRSRCVSSAGRSRHARLSGPAQMPALVPVDRLVCRCIRQAGQTRMRHSSTHPRRSSFAQLSGTIGALARPRSSWPDGLRHQFRYPSPQWPINDLDTCRPITRTRRRSSARLGGGSCRDAPA